VGFHERIGFDDGIDDRPQRTLDGVREPVQRSPVRADEDSGTGHKLTFTITG
jgi:hypothetical protein